MKENLQDQAVLSNEVQAILGKKFSWIIRNGNALLLISVLLITLVAYSLKIPVFLTAKGNAVLISQTEKQRLNTYNVTFKVPIAQIHHLKPSTKLTLTFPFLPDQAFETLVTEIGSEIVSDSITVQSTANVNLSEYVQQKITKAPAEVQMQLGEKNIFNYFIQ